MLKVLPAVNANPCTGTWPKKTLRDVQVWLHGIFLWLMKCSHLYSLTVSVVLFVTFTTLVNRMFLMLLNGNTKLPMIPAVTFRNQAIISWVCLPAAEPGCDLKLQWCSLHMADLLERSRIFTCNPEIRTWLIVLRKKSAFSLYFISYLGV